MPFFASAPTPVGKRSAANVRRALTEQGSRYTYGRSGSTFGIIGKMSITAFADYSARFDRTETDNWAKPAYYFRIPGEFEVPGLGVPRVGDTVLIPAIRPTGQDQFDTYTVRGVFYDGIGNVVTQTRLYLARLIA